MEPIKNVGELKKFLENIPDDESINLCILEKAEHPVATLIGILIFFVLCCIDDKACNSEKGKKWKNTQE